MPVKFRDNNVCECVRSGGTLKHFRVILKRCQQNLCKWYVNATYMEISIRSQNAPKASSKVGAGKRRRHRRRKRGCEFWGGGVGKWAEKCRVARTAPCDVAATLSALLVKVLISCYMCQNFNDADKSLPPLPRNCLLCASVCVQVGAQETKFMPVSVCVCVSAKVLLSFELLGCPYSGLNYLIISPLSRN